MVVHTSGLTITGGTNAPRIDGDNTGSTKPGLTLDGVSDVTISHLAITTAGVPAALAVKGSSRITLDSVNVGAYGTAVAIDGASDTAAVTRSHVGLFTAGATAISVAADPNTVADYQSGHPYPVDAPNTSSLNWRRGDTVPNLVQATPGRGVIDFFNQSDGNADLIVDIFGYYQNG